MIKLLSRIKRTIEPTRSITEKGGLGTVHAYWAQQKETLRGWGIKWKTPAEMNPDIIFD